MIIPESTSVFMSKIGTKSSYEHETASVKVTGYLTTLQIWINKPGVRC
jgi:hypothetical protein